MALTYSNCNYYNSAYWEYETVTLTKKPPKKEEDLSCCSKMCANVLGFVVTFIIILIVLGIVFGDKSKEGIERFMMDEKGNKRMNETIDTETFMWIFYSLFSIVVRIIMHSCCDVGK